MCAVCTQRCAKWRNVILSKCTKGTSPCWQNTDMYEWKTGPWEIAKVFMKSGQQASMAGAADTDPIGLLQLVLNCQLFTECISNRQSFEVVS